MINRITHSWIKWDLVDIILVMAITFSLTPLLFWAMMWGLRVDFVLQNKELALNLIQAFLLGALTLGIVNGKYNVGLREFGLRRIEIDTGLKYGIVGGALLCLMVLGVNNITHNLVANIFGVAPPTQRVIQSLLETKTRLLFILHSLLIVVVAPVAEEIFFRGLIYPYCRFRLGETKGMLVNGIVFGAAHFSWWVFFPTFLGGIILAWIYQRTKSLYSSILAHGVWNLIIVLLVYIIWKMGVI